MITRLAERLATAPSAEKASVERPPLEVTSADSLLQSSAPAVVDPRVRTVLQYVESRHVNSACRLDDVARNLRVSRSYLSRLVFKETGVTFNRHLQSRAYEHRGAAAAGKRVEASRKFRRAPAMSTCPVSTASSAATSTSRPGTSAAPSASRSCAAPHTFHAMRTR
jgi:AraC-like DNA-binding protein